MNALEQINSLIAANQTKPNQSPQSPQSQQALQQAAKQFEAILLMQLTSALSGSNNDDEDALFGGDSGSSLAKQMFSEQMATTMADSGGIGLAEMMMQQYGLDPAKLSSKKTDGMIKMMTAIKDIKEKAVPMQQFKTNAAPLINRSARMTALPSETFAGDPNDAAVVSTFEDQLKEQANDTTISPLFRNEKVYAATRARRVNVAASIDAAEMTPATVSSNSAPAEVSGPISFNFPVRGRISSGFGNRFHPIDKIVKFHTGLDIAVPRGTRVDAAAEGTVVFAGPKGGYGNLVIIRHPDGKETRYGHLQKILVSEGESVTSRQQIALSGSTGKSTGPHLHFEIRENGEILNPLKYLSNVLPKSADR
ncbi:MAG TPA: peptidoglycan DD-metalloendopeptidase family protein [Pyrinomonadaceae bacterium]|jgi:murein DD-endopeptidase MepM/ murein hydrolase activator NlpD|nr:peptidoglycan DD-metalloendopeptidase family protein [Pyrinomonadaceae bacterium]